MKLSMTRFRSSAYEVAQRYLTLLNVIIAVVFAGSFSNSQAQNKAVVGYYYFWDKSAFPYTEIEFNKVTCISHAFIVPNSDGTLSPEPGATMSDYLYPQMITAAHSANVKVVVTVGGYGDGKGYGFSSIAAGATARANFAGNLKDFCLQYDYDGVDIDWEYPGAGDRANFVLMMRAVHDSLASAGRNLSLSAAVPGYIGSGYDFGALDSLLDWVGVMTYDYYGSWTSVSGFVSPLYDPAPGATTDNEGSINSSMTQFLQGTTIPSSKLFMGLAFYGYNFQAAGLYKPRTGAAPSVSYANAVAYQNSGWTYHWDDVSKGPYLTDASGTHIITFDDTNSIALKCNYLKNKNLGGVIIWRLGLDYVSGSQPLLETTWKKLNTPTAIVFQPNVPDRTSALQNFPNPFNPITVISYKLSANSHVGLKIYDVLGREVGLLVNRIENAGQHEVMFDATKLSSGVYFYVLSINGKSFSKSMLYLK